MVLLVATSSQGCFEAVCPFCSAVHLSVAPTGCIAAQQGAGPRTDSVPSCSFPTSSPLCHSTLLSRFQHYEALALKLLKAWLDEAPSGGTFAWVWGLQPQCNTALQFEGRCCCSVSQRRLTLSSADCCTRLTCH